MSVADVQRAFSRGLGGNAACKVATIELEDGGRSQRLNFHVVSASRGSAYLSEAIPSDMCPMQHARHMAIEFLEGRLAGNSRFETQAPTQTQTLITRNATPTLTPPIAQEVQQAARAPVVAPQPVQTMAPTLTPNQNELAEAEDQLERLILAGDLAGLVELLCVWVDRDAGDVRKHWTTTADGQSLEYEQIRREINDLAYKLIEPTPEACPCLWASVGVDVPRTGDTAADIRAAAAFVNAHVDLTSDFIARVRATRIKAKADIRQAFSIERAMELYQAVQWPIA